MHGKSHTVLLLLNREFTLPVYPTIGIPMKPAEPTLSQQGGRSQGRPCIAVAAQRRPTGELEPIPFKFFDLKGTRQAISLR